MPRLTVRAMGVSGEVLAELLRVRSEPAESFAFEVAGLADGDLHARGDFVPGVAEEIAELNDTSAVGTVGLQAAERQFPFGAGLFGGDAEREFLQGHVGTQAIALQRALRLGMVHKHMAHDFAGYVQEVPRTFDRK